MSPAKIAEPKKKSRTLWPLLGFFMAVSLAVIGFFLEQILHSQILGFLSSRNVLESSLPPNSIPIIFTAAFFIFGLLLSSLVVSVFAPRKTKTIKSTDLIKERQGMLSHQREVRERQRNVSRKFKKTLDNSSKK